MKNKRMEIRLSEEEKQMIESAARSKSMTTTAYILFRCGLQAGERIIDDVRNNGPVNGGKNQEPGLEPLAEH